MRKFGEPPGQPGSVCQLTLVFVWLLHLSQIDAPPLGHSITVEKRACRKRILVFETGITSSIFAMKNIQLSKSSKEGENELRPMIGG